MEDSTNYLHEDSYIVDLDEVIIESYSLNSFSANKAKIIAVQAGKPVPAEQGTPTKFQLIQPKNLREIVINDPLILDDHVALVASDSTILTVYKANITLNNLALSMYYDSADTYRIFLRLVMLGEKYVKISDSKVLNEGLFMKTAQQMNIEIENTEFDFYKSQRGFELYMECISADIETIAKVNGARFFFSQEPLSVFSSRDVEWDQHGGDIILFNNTIFEVYGLIDRSGMSFIHLDRNQCSPGRSRHYSFHNSMLVLPSFTYSLQNELSAIYFRREGQGWDTQIEFRNFTIKDLNITEYPKIFIESNPEGSVLIQDSKFERITVRNMVLVIGCKDLVVRNSVFTDATITGSVFLIPVVLFNLEMTNITFTNTTFLGGLQDTLLNLRIRAFGNINFQNITFNGGMMVDKRTLISLANISGNTTVSGLTISDFSAGNGCSYIKVIESRATILKDLTLSNLNPNKKEEDFTTAIIDLSKLNSTPPSSAMPLSILVDSVLATNNKNKVLVISNPLQDQAFSQTITVNDLTIQDLVDSRREKMIALEDLLSSGTFKVVFNRLVIRNITLGAIQTETGEVQVSYEGIFPLIAFYHQTADTVEINDSIIENCKNIALRVVVSHHLNPEIPKLKFNNLTVSEINNGMGNFIQVGWTSKIWISNSYFERVTNINQGSVLFIFSRNTEFMISNTTFINNTSIDGGVFRINSKSSVIFTG